MGRFFVGSPAAGREIRGQTIMTEQLYQADGYIREFEAVVTVVEGQAVALDRTAFYPGGGGQPHDTGTLSWQGGSLPVIKVQKRGDDVWHTLAGHAPPPGTAVRGLLDWERRYRLMRTHTALHVLCGVVWRDYGAQVTGGNMEPLEGRMDFEFETMHKELVAEIEDRVNAEIEQDRPLRVAILPREAAFLIPDLIRTKINLLPPHIQEVRTVEIVGLDLQADGGTHVAATGEVGRVRVVDYKSKGAINKRIYLQLEP
jgi:misacylated tRNA(Ala) deacylase